MLRRELTLPEEDIEYLNANYQDWETLRNGAWLLIHNYPLPDGYNVPNATIAINIAAYAPGPLDMVYVYPALSRKDGIKINCADVFQQIDGKSFQRWSRHYSWNSEKCNLVTHLIQIEEWFRWEFRKTVG